MPPTSRCMTTAQPGRTSSPPRPAGRLLAWHCSNAVTRGRAIAFAGPDSGRRRVRDRSACSLPVGTASPRDYAWSPMRLSASSQAQDKSDHSADQMRLRGLRRPPKKDRQRLHDMFRHRLCRVVAGLLSRFTGLFFFGASAMGWTPGSDALSVWIASSASARARAPGCLEAGRAQGSRRGTSPWSRVCSRHHQR